jgi:hypothetical protein
MAIVNQPRSFQFFSAISSTPADFNLDAGNYGLLVVWTAGSVTLNKLLPDGVTYAPVSAVIGASGYSVLSLPAGQYRLVIVTGPATVEIVKIDVGRASGR